MCDVVVGSVVPDTASRPLTTTPAGQERALLPPPVTWPPGQEVGGGRPLATDAGLCNDIYCYSEA